MPKQIAIIEDEADLARNYIAALEREGYNVNWYPDRQSAQQAFAKVLPDMAIIDISLGDEARGGHKLCQWLRASSPVLPVVFLTAFDEEVDELTGLALGANEYLSKALSLKIITTRVASLFTMYDALMAMDERSDNVIEQPPLKLDIDCKRAYWRGEQVQLTYTLFLMLECLARHPGHVKNAQQLMDAAGKTIAPESVSSNIKRIRAAFRKVDSACDPVGTEYSVGYFWKGADD